MRNGTTHLVTGGGAASFATITGSPGDNSALAAALALKLDKAGGTMTGALSITAGSLTTSPLAVTQTFNNAGVVCRGLEYAVTDTNSAAGSTLLRLLGGASGTAVKMAVKKEGTWVQNYYGINIQIYDDDGTTLRAYLTQGRWIAKDFNDSANTTSLGRDGAANGGVALAKSSPIVFSGGAQWYAAEACRMLSATGAPEGVVSAGVGSVFLRQDGGAGTTFYIKETGTGNTGWVAK